MQAVQIALSDPEAEPEAVADCVEKLSEWLRRQSTSTQKLIAACRLSPVVVQVMKLHGTDVEVARYCCRIIHGIAYRHSENMASLCKAGVVIGLNELLDYHLEDPQVQEAGTQALEILASKSGAREIVANGGVARLLKIMGEHPDNTYIQRSSWSCLELVVTNCGQLTEAMREEIVGAAGLVKRAMSALLASKHPVDRSTRLKAEKLAAYVQTCVRDHKQPIFVAPQPKKPAEVLPEEPPLVQQEDLDLRAWLSGLDRTGALAHYHAILAQNFDSVPHVVDAYTEDGKLDPQFFEDLGIAKLGHRRKFEQWFQKHFDEQAAAAG